VDPFSDLVVIVMQVSNLNMRELMEFDAEDGLIRFAERINASGP